MPIPITAFDVEHERGDGLHTFDVFVPATSQNTHVKDDSQFFVGAKSFRDACEAFCQIRRPNGARSLAGYLKTMDATVADLEDKNVFGHSGTSGWCCDLVVKDLGSKYAFADETPLYKIQGGKAGVDREYLSRFGVRKRPAVYSVCDSCSAHFKTRAALSSHKRNKHKRI